MFVIDRIGPDHIRVHTVNDRPGECAFELRGGMALVFAITFTNLMVKDEARAADYVIGFGQGMTHQMMTAAAAISPRDIMTGAAAPPPT